MQVQSRKEVADEQVDLRCEGFGKSSLDDQASDENRFRGPLGVGAESRPVCVQWPGVCADGDVLGSVWAQLMYDTISSILMCCEGTR